MTRPGQTPPPPTGAGLARGAASERRWRARPTRCSSLSNGGASPCEGEAIEKSLLSAINVSDRC